MNFKLRCMFSLNVFEFQRPLASPQTSFGVHLSNEPQRTSAGRLSAPVIRLGKKGERHFCVALQITSRYHDFIM